MRLESGGLLDMGWVNCWARRIMLSDGVQGMGLGLLRGLEGRDGLLGWMIGRFFLWSFGSQDGESALGKDVVGILFWGLRSYLLCDGTDDGVPA